MIGIGTYYIPVAIMRDSQLLKRIGQAIQLRKCKSTSTNFKKTSLEKLAHPPISSLHLWRNQHIHQFQAYTFSVIGKSHQFQNYIFGEIGTSTNFKPTSQEKLAHPPISRLYIFVKINISTNFKPTSLVTLAHPLISF